MRYETRRCICVVIVDSDPLARETLQHLLDDPSIEIIAALDQISEAIGIIEKEVPHVVLINWHTDSAIHEELAFVHAVRRVSPTSACLVLSTFDHEDYLGPEAIEAGADGYYRTSSMPGDSLIQVVKLLADGQSVISQGLARELLQQLINAEKGLLPYRVPHEPQLTRMERDVLELKARGEDEDHISRALSISIVNVGRHFRNILRKFFLPAAYEL